MTRQQEAEKRLVNELRRRSEHRRIWSMQSVVTDVIEAIAADPSLLEAFASKMDQCKHGDAIRMYTGGGWPVDFCPECGTNITAEIPESVDWGDLFAEVRDNILYGRGHLEGVLDNDQTNAVLDELDRLDVNHKDGVPK